MKTRRALRFEVSLDHRLKQRKDACDAYRMPRLGYAKCLVFPVPEKSKIVDYVFPNVPIQGGTLVTKPTSSSLYSTSLYGVQSIGRALRPNNSYGQLGIHAAGRLSGKSTYLSWQLAAYFFNNNDIVIPCMSISETKWLKPKHVTMLELKGHKVVPE